LTLFGIHLRVQQRVVQTTEEVYDTVQRIVFAYPLRALDAVPRFN